MNIFKEITFADLFTLLNAAAGFLAIYFIADGNFFLASLMLVLAVGADVLDGTIARILSSGKLGVQLDSLADVISFGVAPAFFAAMYINNPITIIASMLLVAAGMLRLARYNITDQRVTFEGMPITLNGLLFPLLYAVDVFVLDLLPFDISMLLFTLVLIVSATLMVSSIPLKRL